MAVDLNEFCKTIQRKLNNQQIRSGNQIAPDQGTLAYIVSNENKTANKFEFNLDQGDGKVKTGRARFLSRGTKAQYDSAINGNVCEPGGTKGYKYMPYSINQVFNSVKLTFSYDEMRNFCEGKSDHIAEVMASEMKAFRSALNKALVSRLLSGGFIGKFADNVSGPKEIPLFFTHDNKINPMGEVIIEQDMTSAELNSLDPVLIGANLLQTYGTLKGIQCCNREGYNAGMLDEVKGWFLDKTFDQILGTTSNVLALVPGALQLLTFNKNNGDFRIIHPDHTATTIADTLLPGLTYDLYTHMIKCDPDGNDEVTYTVQWKLRWDLWGYPSDLFETSDNLTGVKDVFHYVAVCGDDNICSLTNQLASPIAEFSQTFTAGTPDTLDVDGTGSTAQAAGAVLVTFAWDFGGTIGTIAGAPAATITGVTGVSGTFNHPVIDLSAAIPASEICLRVTDDNLNESAIFCDVAVLA